MAASGSPATPDAQAEWSAPYRVDLRAVLGSSVRGSSDPTIRLAGDGTARVHVAVAELAVHREEDVHAVSIGGRSADLVVGAMHPAGDPHGGDAVDPVQRYEDARRTVR